VSAPERMISVNSANGVEHSQDKKDHYGQDGKAESMMIDRWCVDVGCDWLVLDLIRFCVRGREKQLLEARAEDYIPQKTPLHSTHHELISQITRP